MENLDIVYPYKTDGSGEELRYSLRSLVNIPHRYVWVVGDREPWFSDEIRYIKFDHTQIGKNKYQNVNEALIALSIWDEYEATGRENPSSDYILFNDDFFILQPIDNLPRITNGTLQDKIKALKNNPYTKNNKIYISGLEYALERLKVTNTVCLNYESHLPMIFNQEKYAKIFSQQKDSPARRSLYGNAFIDKDDLRYGMYNLESDCKIYDPEQEISGHPIFISTTANSFHGKAGQYIKQMFTERSIYER